jgi:putative addiction module component (TIGR02574 family)
MLAADATTSVVARERTSMIDIDKLTREERLELLEQLWDSLTPTPEMLPLTSAQREELDRRLDELDLEGPVGIPVEQVLERLRSPHV